MALARRRGRRIVMLSPLDHQQSASSAASPLLTPGAWGPHPPHISNASRLAVSRGLAGRSHWLGRDVEDDGLRSLVQKPLDEIHERIRILKPCTGIEAGDPEEFSVALHAAIYPPRPHFLTFPPASDLHSGHAGPFLRSFIRQILACVRLPVVILASGAIENGVPELSSLRMRTLLRDVMSRDLLTVAPEDTLGEAAEKMAGRGVGAALVMDFGRLIGILTERDLLAAVAGRVQASEARVREWMTENPVTVPQATSIGRAGSIMVTHGFRHLPVVDGDRTIGIVSLRDVVHSVVRKYPEYEDDGE
jgi:CBS domain-containing protein